MTADIITLPNVLAQRIRGAYERTERGRQEWIEGTLELAAALAEARLQFASDKLFSVWLAENELDQIAKDDRAALINMATHATTARSVLQETNRNSWRWVWLEEVEPMVRQLAKPDLPRPESPNATSIPAPAANPIWETKPVSTPTSPPKPKPLKRDHPFHGMERAEEVTAAYASVEARGAIGKAIRARGGKEIWALILQAIDAGFLTRTETQFTTINLRILFPGASKAFGNRFDLTLPKDRQRVRDDIMPAALANRAAVIASPERIESILIDYAQRQQHEAQERAAKRRVDDAVQAMPVDQREVVMFGERLWPRTEHRFGTYDYEQLCAAIWYFRDLDGWLEGRANDNSPRSRAILVRLSTRWPEEYVDRACEGEPRAKIKKVYQLVHTLARLFENNPAGECIIPPTPKIEGQW